MTNLYDPKNDRTHFTVLIAMWIPIILTVVAIAIVIVVGLTLIIAALGLVLG